MNCLVLIVLVTIINRISSSQSNSGHLKPFGTVGSLIEIEQINGEYPDALKFFTHYLTNSETFVSRHVLNNDIYFHMWKTDEKLENQVDGLSKQNIHVESIKKQKRIQMKFSDFIDKYQKEELILADNLPEILRKYLVVPQPLQCDAVLHTFQSAILIMNDVNTSPLIFNEEYDSLLCLLRGNKRLVLVNTNKYPDVQNLFISQNGQIRRPSINPDKVDFNQYPEFSNVDYHVANLTEGDCLFIPSNWIFQERSFDSSISITYNIHHKQGLNVDLNQVETCSINKTFDSSFTLDQIDWSIIDSEPQNLKEVMLSLINSKSNRFEKWQETFSKHLSFNLSSDPETSSLFEEFYGIIDVDGNGEITISEIEQIDGAHHHHISDILYEIVKLVNNKQNYKSSEQLNDSLEEKGNYDEDLNEQITNEKEDL